MAKIKEENKKEEKKGKVFNFSLKNIEDALEILKKDDVKHLQGIKEIPFMVLAHGKGIVNKNGNEHDSFYYNPEKDGFNNIIYPKAKKDRNNKTRIIASSVCIKEAMFKNEKGLKDAKSVETLLLSSYGLLNGYMCATTSKANRPSSVILTDFITDFDDFIFNNQDEKEIDEKIVEAFKKHKLILNSKMLENNGKTQFFTGTKTESVKVKEETSNSFYHTVVPISEDVFYNSKGVFLLERLQFIPVRGEMGKNQGGDYFVEDDKAKIFAEILTYFLKNKKENLLSSLEKENKFMLQNKTLMKFIDFLKDEKEDVAVDFGYYRYAGNLNQILDSSITEAGFKLNQKAMCLLLLEYFNLLLNTTVYRSNNAYLKIVDVLFEKEFDEIKFADFYVKVE